MRIRDVIRGVIIGIFQVVIDALTADRPKHAWSVTADPQRPDHSIYDLLLPGDYNFMVSETSAPEDGKGAWGWILQKECNVQEMRNGFDTADEAKTHAERHWRDAYQQVQN